MFLRRSMVSYMPCTSRSLSTEPSICLSSTRPTRKTIFTPVITANRQVTFQNLDMLGLFGRSLRVVPSQKNMSHTRSTQAHGNVREKMHMNHSVM